jgi:hypothetical protein
MKKRKLRYLLVCLSLLNFCGITKSGNITISNQARKINNINSIAQIQLEDINNIDSSIHEIKSVDLVDSLSSNQLVLTSFYPSGYSIYDCNSKTIVEVIPNATLETTSDKYYVFLDGLHDKSELISTTSDDEDDSLSQLNDYNTSYFDALKQDSLYKENEISVVSDNNNPVYVEFYKYFELNKYNYAWDTKGICGYVALSLILGYNEFIKCHGYFSYDEESKYIEPAQGPMLIDTVPKISDDFITYAFGIDIGESWSQTIDDAAKKFLTGKNVEYELYNRYWHFGHVTDPIKNNDEPVILFGSLPNSPVTKDNADSASSYNGSYVNHAVVVYGYYPNDNRLICHYGWKNHPEYTKAVIAYPSYFKLGSMFSIINKSEHKCCQSYYDESDGMEYYCARGCY